MVEAVLARLKKAALIAKMKSRVEGGERGVGVSCPVKQGYCTYIQRMQQYSTGIAQLKGARVCSTKTAWAACLTLLVDKYFIPASRRYMSGRLSLYYVLHT